MVSCEIDNENGNEVLKWKKLEEDEGHQNTQESPNPDDSVNQMILNKSQNNLIETTSLLENTSNNIYELYPPEDINLNDINKEEKNIIKEMPEENELKRYYSMTSFKSKDYVPPLMVEEEDFPTNFCKDDTFGIAITGPTFERLYRLNERFLKTKDQLYQTAHDAYRLVLKNGRVFARMAPEHKALLVDGLKKEGFTTLMCGDGANDCSALRTAHVSVSLSAEEASIAANFTSKQPDVSCIYELLREGKCSLTTSIQTFKYMMLYSMIQFFCVTFEMNV
jgi:cation-transporting ATPase 13A3/4/5